MFTNTNASPYDIGAIGSNFAENLFSILNLTQFTAGDQVEISNGTSSFRLTLVTQGTVLGGVNGTVISGTQTGFAVNGLTGTITLLVAVAGGITIAGDATVNGDFSTQGLEVNKYLTDGSGNKGTDGQVLTSSTQGADKEVRWVNASTVGDTYTIQSTSTPGVNRVPIDLTAASGAAASSILNLVEGTGITLAQTSATEITISGSAQGVTGSGTSGKLPKFDTATSLDDSIVTQTGGTTTIIPLNDGPSLPASISFSPQTSQFSMPNYATYNTVTGPAPQVGDVFNFVLTSDLVWAVGGGVIPAGTYPFTITFVSSGLSCSFNSYTIPASASGLGYTNLLGNGSSTSVNTVDALSIDGELSMATHKIINVVNPTDAQDAATKAYVDASSSDTTYTLAAGAKTSSSVPLNLSPSTGSDTTVNLTEGTGITLTQTSATEITIEGTAQGVTGSGTVNKLPKFGTTTSLTDSLVSEVPASSSSSYTATNSFFVQAMRYRSRRCSIAVLGKDLANYLGFFCIDRPIAANRSAVRAPFFNDVIPVSYPTSGFALTNTSLKTSTRFIGQVFQVQGRHCAFEADVELVDLTFRRRENGNTGERHRLVKTGNVFLVAA